jgi:putative ABC transport system permease protein
MYGTYRQNQTRLMSVVTRTSGPATGAAASLRDLVKSVDRDLPVSKVTTMEQLLSDSMARPRFNTLLITVFAAVGMLLAMVGIYGVISYGVTQRVHEIGVRLALGATGGDVFHLVLKKGLKLALFGVGIGLVLSLMAGRLLSTLLFGVGAKDPMTFVGLSLVVVVVTMVASYLPARRATRVDPMVALRYE